MRKSKLLEFVFTLSMAAISGAILSLFEAPLFGWFSMVWMVAAGIVIGWVSTVIFK